MATLVTGTGLDGKQYKRHRGKIMGNVKPHQGDATSSVTYLFNGCSTISLSCGKQTPGRSGWKPRVKKTDSEWLLR